MGRALYQSNSRHPSPSSPSRPVASPCSPNHFPSIPKSPSYMARRSPSYISPRSPRYLSPLSPKHPKYPSPPPEPQVFVDAQNKDLPFDGNCKRPSHFTFEPCLGLKEQGELLMNFLTGVPGSPMEKFVPRMHNLNSSKVVGPEHQPQSPHEAQTAKNFLDINRRRVEKKRASPSHPHCVDVAVDTMDLEELTGDGDDDETDYDEREEAQRKLDMELEEHDGKKTITLEDYLEMVKKSTGRIGLQAQLLHELSLGEDVNMGIPDSELPAVPSMEKMGTEIKPGESQSKDQETKAIPIYRGAMRATSLVIKRLRRMAGLMHVEQQNIDLKDIYEWLQHLGYLATSSGKLVSSRLGSSAGHSSVHSVTGEKIDWRLPSSPAQALEMAQADLRDRLAYLYEEQNQIKNRKEQLEAAKRIVGRRMSKVEVKKLSKYLHNLKSLESSEVVQYEMTQEVRYEELGGRIVQNLDDVKSLETQFQNLSEKDKVDEEGKRKGGKKQRKQESNLAETRGKDSPTNGDEGIGKSTTNITKKEKEKLKDSLDGRESQDSSRVSDGDQSDNERMKRKRSVMEQGRSDGAAVRKGSTRETDSEGFSSGRKPGEDHAKRFGMGGNIQHEGASERVGLKRTEEQEHSFSRMAGMRGEDEGYMKDEDGKVLESGAVYMNKRGVSRQQVATSDKEMQTDNSELLSLMESMIDAMNEEAPDGAESPAAKLKRLFTENKRMQVQLRFWRSRNWYESTMGSRVSRSESRSSSRSGFPFPPPIMDSSSEDDLSIYFNPIRPPSILNQGALSGGSSARDNHQYAQATGRPGIRSSTRGQEGPNRSMPLPSQTVKSKVLQQNLPSIPAASSPNRSNTDILLDTLQDMQLPHLEANIDNADSSRSRNPDQGITQSSPSDPMKSKFNFKSPSQRFQPLVSDRGHIQQMAIVPPSLLEPLNAALLTNTQSPGPQVPQQLSSKFPSSQLQPIPAEVLNAALRSNAPHQSPRQLSSRTIPSLNFSSLDKFRPSKSLSAASRMPKVKKSLHPLQSEPNTSRVNMQVSPTEQRNDTLVSGSLPAAQPVENDTQPTGSPRTARNVAQNPSPRSPRPLANSQQIQDSQVVPNTSGSPPRSPRRLASPIRRSHAPPSSQGQLHAENGLMVVGRSSSTQ